MKIKNKLNTKISNLVKLIIIIITPILLISAICVLIQIKNDYTFNEPNTFEVLGLFFKNLLNGKVWIYLYTTLYVAIKGLFLGIFLAFIFLIFFGFFPKAIKYFAGMINSIRAIPLTLLVPFIAVFPKVFLTPPFLNKSSDFPTIDPSYLIALGCFLYLVIAIIEGIENRNKQRERLYKINIGFSKWKYLWKILFFEILPTLLYAFRISLLFGIVLTIVLEQITGYPGIGNKIYQLLLSKNQNENTGANILSLILIMSYFGIIIDALFKKFSEKIVKW